MKIFLKELGTNTDNYILLDNKGTRYLYKNDDTYEIVSVVLTFGSIIIRTYTESTLDSAVELFKMDKPNRQFDTYIVLSEHNVIHCENNKVEIQVQTPSSRYKVQVDTESCKRLFTLFNVDREY